MSNSPADLGSAYSRVGFTYDPTGLNAFIAAGRQAQQFTAQFQQTQQRQVSAQQQQAQAARQHATAQQQLAAAQLRVNLAQTDAAGRVRILQAELRRLTQGSLDYLRIQERLIQAERRLASEQARQQRGLGPALPRTFAGFTGAGLLQGAGALGLATSGAEIIASLRQQADEGRRVSLAIDGTRRSLGALIQDQDRANRIMAEGSDIGRRYGFTQREIADAIQSSSLIFRQSTTSVEEVISVLSRLSALSPEQGLEGAAFAIRELASGDIVSLVERFEVSRQAANRWKDEVKAGADVVDVLNRGLNELGATQDIVEARTQGITGEQHAYNQALEDFQVRLAELVRSTGWREFTTTFFRTTTTALGGGPIGSGDFQRQMALASASYEEFAQKQRDTLRQLLGDTEMSGQGVQHNVEGVALLFNLLSRAEYEALKAQQAYTDAQAIGTRQTDIYTAGLRAHEQQVRQGATAYDIYSQSAQRAADSAQAEREAQRIAAVEVQSRQRDAYTQSVIRSHEQVVEATQRRDARLADLETEHNQRVADLTAERAQVQIDAAREVAAVEGRYLAERSALIAENNARIEAFVADHAQQTTRLLADQQRADARAAEDFADQQADAYARYTDQRADQIARFNEQQIEAEQAYQERRGEIIESARRADVDAEQAYQERREDIITSAARQAADSEQSYRERREAIITRYNDQERRLAEEQARDLARAQRESQVSQYRSTADFLERLYGLTRGRRNKAELEAARAAFRAAQAEAAELARLDPAAAAAFLQESQRQILENLEAEREARKLRRSARRGGGLTAGDVEAEISEVNRAREEANRATLDAIRAGARERAADREREATERREGRDEALAELDRQQADERERRQRARDEQLAELDEQRREEKARRDAARAEQLADLDREHAEAREKRAADHAAQLRETDAAFQAQQAERVRQRDIQLAREAEDRRIDKERRDADYAAQLKDLQVSNAARLTEFDTRHRERVAQINAHAREQQAAIDAQLAAENTAYDESRKEINREYDAFLLELRIKLQREANNLQFTPEQQVIQDRERAFKALGELFGDAFMAGLNGKLTGTPVQYPYPAYLGGQPPTNTPLIGNVPRSGAPRGGSVRTGDPALSGRALDSVVLGGRQSGSFNDIRSGALHGGVDIAAAEGTPIKSPVDGTIIESGYSATGGNYTKLRTATGDVWYFGHLRDAGPKAGTYIRRGQTLGFVGQTGSAITGPHLHLAYRPGGGQLADPSRVLEQIAGARGTTPGSAQGFQARSYGTSPVGARTPMGGVHGSPFAMRPLDPIPPAGGGACPVMITVNLDLRGSSGVDADAVRRAAYAGTNEAVAALGRGLVSGVKKLRLQGPFQGR